ncbi:MAG: Nif3-like dinuclear metal center hexameric protein [Bacteroidetes bacterium]|nr:Nif3-like dinuclear metal center hexameric protein [Bacteroidota bacterium]HET6244871.1 Nif3-like dinuclear metal center hexameric protein [Bacteroidia bacterium]
MFIHDVIDLIEDFAPLQLQESYDNSGLITGDKNWKVQKILLCIDTTEAVIDEAIFKGCNLIIAHHPIVFKGLKKFTGEDYVQRTIIKALKNDIAIYAAHTNMDNVYDGVSARICQKLNLKNKKVLSPKKNILKKIITFCPQEQAEKVKTALFNAGAGKIGNYSECSFNSSGTGTFRPSENANPFVGEKGKRHTENELRIETIFPFYLENKIIKALLDSHPYEEVAYDVITLENKHNSIGSGMIAEVENPQHETDFLNFIKKQMNAQCIRHTAILNKEIKKVAVCGGSGSFLVQNAIAAGADIFITSDFKYHEFFDAEGKILIADIGHYESEQFTMDIFYELILKNFPTFAVYLTETNTNPVKYL